MFNRILQASISHRWMVMFAVAAMAVLGITSYQKLPIDAVPDITNVQVQINTAAPGYSPLETEQRITFPIESLMAGLPSLEQTRSLSRYGLSQITVVFKDGTDIHFARQLIGQRIQDAREVAAWRDANHEPDRHRVVGNLPVDGRCGAGRQKADGTAYTPTDLREIQDWIIKPQLRNVPGVTEINSIGGYDKEYLVAPSPARLASYGLTLADVVTALERNNANVGA
ncbi:efflux RND transporter permease subunit [Massilia sp. B-10]|nr:efflux RND transporter permease subunit [Massilia sp. B-10]